MSVFVNSAMYEKEEERGWGERVRERERKEIE